MRNTKAIGTFNVSNTLVVKKNGQKIFRQRTTNRYKAKGTISSNQGYFEVMHGADGRFTSKKIA